MGSGVVPPGAAARLVPRAQALRDRYSWAELYAFGGVVYLPYEVSTMTLFELYTANVPLVCAPCHKGPAPPPLPTPTRPPSAHDGCSHMVHVHTW